MRLVVTETFRMKGGTNASVLWRELMFGVGVRGGWT